MRLFGRNPVLERLRSNPSSITRIVMQDDFKEAGLFHKKASSCSIPVFVVPYTKILKLTQGVNSQGIVADTKDFEYEAFSDLLEQALKNRRTILFLDSLTDPQNLGAIIRSIACLGRFSVVLPTHDSAKITPAVLRVASAGENYVPMALVGNRRNAMREAKEEGVQIIGSVVKGGQSLLETEFQFPVGIVIGSEEKGVRDVIRKEVDLEVTIPMSIETISFNVAQATTILCYEVTRQKKSKRIQES